MDAVVIRTDGSIEEISMPSTDAFLFMYDVIGCHTVAPVSLTSSLEMWVDDNGFYTKPVNPAATALARKYGFVFQPYFGTAVVCGC